MAKDKIMKYLILTTLLLFTACSQTTVKGTDCKLHNGKRMSCERYDIISTTDIRLIKD